MDYVEASRIVPGDTISYLDDRGDEHSSVVTGPIHDYSDRHVSRVVYVPIRGGFVNRERIVSVRSDAEPVPG
jgi:hypothetical protein